jgi:alkylhydroperoxidase family enzyme
MPWIRTIPPGEAEGLLKQIYDEAVERAGKVFNVVSIQSLRPDVLAAGLEIYKALMLSDRSPLTRAQREMIAVAVSRANDCHY